MLPLRASINFSQFCTWFFHLHFVLNNNLSRASGSLVVKKLVISFNSFVVSNFPFIQKVSSVFVFMYVSTVLVPVSSLVFVKAIFRFSCLCLCFSVSRLLVWTTLYHLSSSYSKIYTYFFPPFFVMQYQMTIHFFILSIVILPLSAYQLYSFMCG